MGNQLNTHIIEKSVYTVRVSQKHRQINLQNIKKNIFHSL